MFRWLLFLSLGASALLWQLGDPGRVHAQQAGSSLRLVGRPMFRPGFRGGFMPGFRGMPMSRFNPGFGRFDRFEDRFENRFPFGRFDRFEDRFENRFPFGRFDRFEDRFENRFFDPRFR
jgi:hypothetical protein